MMSLGTSTLALGEAFDAGAIDANRQTITFPQAHFFQTGDRVAYHSDGGSVSGLSTGVDYYVIVVNSRTIRLTTNQSEALNGEAQHSFTPGDITGNTIAGTGLTGGQVVIYHAPQPVTFASTQVNFIAAYRDQNGSGTSSCTPGTTGCALAKNQSLSQVPGLNDIYFLDGNGDPFNAGFANGQVIVYHVTSPDGTSAGVAITGLQDGGVYRVVTHSCDSTGGDCIQLKHNTAFTGSVDWSASGGNYQILRTDGLDWRDYGYGAGQTIAVSNGLNTGSYTIVSVSGSTMTVSTGSSVTLTRITANLTFTHTAATQNTPEVNTITRNDVNNWNGTNLSSGTIFISGTALNNTQFTITGVNGAVLTISNGTPVQTENNVAGVLVHKAVTDTIDEGIITLTGVTSAPSPLPAPPATVSSASTFQGDVDFIRSATGDQIVRLDGLTWASNGYQTGGTIHVTG
ncbi:MAG TPA: hypothetical protein VKJ07_13530, partial [Mycobacteriales bacterium]|nr:hypothetical protein [Mycobacteriales bacterium]